MSKSENKQFNFYTVSENKEIPKVSYRTDIIAVKPRLLPFDGATQEELGLRLNALAEIAVFWFHTSAKTDPSRIITIYILWRQQKAGGGTISCKRTYSKANLDGSTTRTSFLGPDDPVTLPSRSQTRYGEVIWTIPASDVLASHIYDVVIKDGADNQDWYIADVTIEYYQRRSLE